MVLAPLVYGCLKPHNKGTVTNNYCESNIGHYKVGENNQRLKKQHL